MRKIIGTLFMTVGLVLIGIGTFDGFEKIGKDLMRDNKNSYYDGLYLTEGDCIMVTSEDSENIYVLLNNETYEFKYNGKYFINEDSGFYIVFSNEELLLYKDGEKIRTLQKEKK